MGGKKIVLKRAGFGYGFLLKDPGAPFVLTATIGRVEPGGVADLSGLRVGDRIRSINGYSVQSMTFLQASNLIRASSEFIELEVDTSDGILVRPVSPVRSQVVSVTGRNQPPVIMHELQHQLEAWNLTPHHPGFGSRMDIVPPRRDEMHVKTVRPLPDVANSMSGTVAEGVHLPTVSSSASSIFDSISSPICPNLNPNRLSTPFPTTFVSTDGTDIPTTTTSTVGFSSHTQCTQLAPLARLTRTPLASFNQSFDQSGLNTQGVNELLPSTLGDGGSTSKDAARRHVVDKDFKLYAQGAPQSGANLTSETSPFTGDSRLKETPFLDNVRVRHLDANVTKKAHRRQTFTRACLDGDIGDGGMPPVRFVRKRAYASARQAGRCDQFAAFSCSPNESGVSQSVAPSLINNESSSGAFQLLPADTQSTPPSVSLVEPKITHLPRRRSSKQQQRLSRPSVDARPSHTTSEYKRIDDVSACTVTTSDTYEAVPDDDDNDRNLNTGSESVTHSEQQRNDLEASDAVHIQVTDDTPNRLLGRLWASFDSDPEDGPVDWWSRAGEAYQILDLEYERLMRRQNELQQRCQRSKRNEISDDHNRGSNKENKNSDCASFDKSEMGSLSKGPIARMSASVSSHGTWSSPSSRRGDNSVLPFATSQISGIESQTSTHIGNVRHRHLRHLCSGLRYHRSESNIHHASFRSRQSLCKILSLDGTIIKSFSWKPYCMCIAGPEVRFVKASSAFATSVRKSKSARQLCDTATTHNASALDMVNDQRPLDASFSGFDSQLEPVSVTSSSHLVLPLPGLIWRQEQIPPDFPQWRPMAYSGLCTNTQKPGPVPDLMDPFHSGLSEPSDSVTTATNINSNPNDDLVLQTALQCYRFAHLAANVELLFVFPDKNTAMACLKLCEMSGGREAPSDSDFPSDAERSIRKPYELVFLTRSRGKNYLSSTDNVTKTEADGVMKAEGPRVETDIVSEPHSNTQCKLTDRRQRRLDKPFSFHPEFTTRVINSSTPDSEKAVPSSTSVESRTRERTIEIQSSHGFIAVTTTGASDERASQRPIKSRNTGPFLRGIKQWLNRPMLPSGIGGSSTDHQEVQDAPISLAKKLSAILADNADLSDFETPGAIFGAPLEKQVSSPDHKCVPVILHAFVVALESHGLQLAGLYRKPGRHRTIAQFVCVANLVPQNIDLLLRMDAWGEPNALCGLVKQYLRRLPVGLFTSATWEPLASLVDSTSDNQPQRAYLLLSIRVKLRKLAIEAFGIPCGHIISTQSSIADGSSELEVSVNSCGNAANSRCADCLNDSHPIKVTLATWRWATLCFLVSHIRDVVALQHLNEVSFRCISICFGPVFFADSTNLSRLNEVLENLFRHWPWLIRDLPMVTPDSLHTSGPVLANRISEYTLSEAIDYLTQCEASPTTVSQTVLDQNLSLKNQAKSNMVEPLKRSEDDSRASESQSNDQMHADCRDGVHHVIRSLLERAIGSKYTMDDEIQSSDNPETGESATALHRVSSALSSAQQTSAFRPNYASGRRRKTMDARNNAQSVNSAAQVEHRRPKPGRSGLNPRHMDPILGDSKTDQSNRFSGSTGFSRADGVIPRPSVPSRTYRSTHASDRPSLTKSPS